MDTTTKNLPFFDSLWYCYANSTAMLLSSFGFNVKPSTIEALSGVGLGAHFEYSYLFFSGRTAHPDRGISKALELLGYTSEEKSQADPDHPPFTEIERLLESSPVVIGPLDIALLTYNPDRPRGTGIDHFVVIYAIDGDKVYLNDPAGYAHVFMSKAELAEAWRAEAIGYRREYYRYWASPRRSDTPSDETTYKRALEFFKALYTESQQSGSMVDADAIRSLANRVKEKSISDDQAGFMTGFSLPLGAKRAYHYAHFFQANNSKIAELKQAQSKAFGSAHAHTMYRDWTKLSVSLNQIAELEAAIKEAVLAA